MGRSRPSILIPCSRFSFFSGDHTEEIGSCPSFRIRAPRHSEAANSPHRGDSVITERKRAEAALQEARAELERLTIALIRWKAESFREDANIRVSSRVFFYFIKAVASSKEIRASSHATHESPKSTA